MADVSTRVLVVDDSGLMRRMIADLIESGDGFTVIGTARTGREAVAKALSLKPDVITMDVEMPDMDGIAALGEIMRLRPTPVVMLSSVTRRGAEATIKCLELGAVDFVCKPSGSISMDIAEVKALLLGKLRLASQARLLGPPSVPAVPAVSPQAPGPPPAAAEAIVVIASSTGGPRALETIIPQLPADLPAAVLVAQHMPVGFTAAMAQRLGTLSRLPVSEATGRSRITERSVFIAPGGLHLLVDRRGRAATSDAPPVWGVRPAADILMESAAAAYGPACVGVVLTGMGRDGAKGIAAIRRAGGRTIAQDEATCVVYGMPRAAVELGGVETSLPLPEIPTAIGRALRSLRVAAPPVGSLSTPIPEKGQR